MTQLNSRLDPASDSFKANAARMDELVAELKARTEEAALGGPERAREKHLARRAPAGPRHAVSGDRRSGGQGHV